MPHLPSEEKLASDRATGEVRRSANWYQALELEERGTSANDPADGELAERRLADWRSQPPFAERPDLWQRRLSAWGVGEEELRALLGEDPSALRERCGTTPPPWLAEIFAAYASASSPRAPTDPFDWPASADRDRSHFLPLVEPLIHRAHRRLRDAARALLERHPDAPFDADRAARLLTVTLPILLHPMLSRAMVVELHVARLEERLAGENSEERFASFVDQLRDPRRAFEILERYPVLARQLVERIAQWEASGSELLRRLAADGGEISKRFAGGRLGRLSGVRGAAGDPHRGGRSVHILTFDEDVRVVYKPRPLAAERAFQEVLGWVNEKEVEAPFRQLEILDAGSYGWVEFVAPEPCSQLAEVQRFYYRMGGYLAILYLLDGTDFHHENLIAAGEHPVLIDLETLFQPWVAGRSLEEVEHQPGAALRATVLRSDLLPEHWWGSDEEAGVDLSGMGSKAGQLTPRPVVATAEGGTDTMRLERRRVEIPEGENRPRLGDQDIPLLDHADDLLRGFRDLYHLFAKHRQEWLEPDGPLAAFRGTEVRLLFRMTATFGALLYESYHPHLVANALDRQQFFDRLWRDLPHRPWLERLIPLELDSLSIGDIPLFATGPESRDIHTADGDRVADFLEESGFERVERRLAELSPLDRARQEAVIRDTFALLKVSAEKSKRPAFHFSEAAVPAGRDQLLEAARRAGEKVVERAFRGGGEAHWMTVTYREPNGWQLVPAGPDVYLGLPGIALALGYLGMVSGEGEYTAVARQALFSMQRQLADAPEMLEGVGAFSGWGGVIYTLTHLGALWGDEGLLDEAEACLRLLPEKVSQDELLDVVAGSAGCILALLGLLEHRPSDLLLELLRACGDRLLAAAEPQDRGLGWVMPLAGPRPLAGFSHGAAGIALSLLRLAAVTGDERYRRAALAGIEYERSLYLGEELNWPDLRAGAPASAGLDGFDGHLIWAWCHGAPGIGLARLLGLPWHDDARVREEIEHAVSSTRARGFGQNHSLCHGDLGNLEFLLEVARAEKDEAELARVYRLAGGILESVERDGWLFGLPGSLRTPGLMVGLAGIAYGLARLADPDRLPSILALSPPPKSNNESERRYVAATHRAEPTGLRLRSRI